METRKKAGSPATAPGLWQSGLEARQARAPLEHDKSADVAIVGAGFTGLWTAYYLRVLAPELSVVVLEAETVGFGASGRNGGWCFGELPGGPAPWARRYGREAAATLQRAVDDTVAEVGRVVAHEGIDCGYKHGGARFVAVNKPQADRLAATVSARHALGFGPTDLRLLDAAETREHLAVPGVVASSFTPHCAALDPARLARGLAAAVEARGGVIHEGSPVVEVLPSLVRTDRATVRAKTVVLATEAFTGSIPGARLAGPPPAPIYSYMIATEPLAEEFWRSVGWADRATLADQRLHFTYLQRTADDRIALGGRGVGVPWSHPHAALDESAPVHRRLVATLHELFPGAADAAVTHRWGGPLAMPRDFRPSVAYDAAHGVARAGGYGGNGVSLANLAGRTAARLVADLDGPETRLCWTNHRSPRWEPQPLRYLGTSAGDVLAHGVDRFESRTGRTVPVVGPLIARLLH
ncbi:FAD-binding oxidoreductase [Actinocorallia sp. API 0066]|uniref:NAD(P)/FAD-dependent oxidoreductase n=1 Tax=Actinocorallia sp. API 0066 TaxID=2896846 RepID=UPI001E5ADEB5|nr:FAD-binding oxidoreductase [Actinocorallia sp. API 0066]MCD0449260.1 FAD-binding oxidoreductase [Actinocorallia sp. API 0066]